MDPEGELVQAGGYPPLSPQEGGSAARLLWELCRGGLAGGGVLPRRPPGQGGLAGPGGTAGAGKGLMDS